MSKLYYILTIFFTLATLSSCNDADVYNPDAVRPNYPLGAGVIAPEGFDWKMTSEVQLSVDVTDLYNAQYEYLIEVFPQDPAKNSELLPMAAGYANTDKTYYTTIVLPDTYTTVYLRQTAPDGTQTLVACPLSGTETYYKFEGIQTKSQAGKLHTANYPSELKTNATPYTFCFEDQWPNYGDFDMNDVVLYVTEIKNRESGRGIKIETAIEAVGASKNIGLGVQFKALDKAWDYESIRVESKTKDEEDRTFETGCEHPCIVIFDNVHYAVNQQTDYKFINTSTIKDEGVKSSHRIINIYIDRKEEQMPQEAYNINNIDFFIITGTDSEGKRIEVHTPGYAPTKKGSTALFGQGDDDSSIGNKYYLSEDNLCWAFVVPTEFAWPAERMNIRNVYSEFVGWVTSGGENNTNWYEKKNDNVYDVR